MVTSLSSDPCKANTGLAFSHFLENSAIARCVMVNVEFDPSQQAAPSTMPMRIFCEYASMPESRILWSPGRYIATPTLGGGKPAVNNYFLALISSSKQRSNPAPVIFLAMCGCLRNHAAASSIVYTFCICFSKIRQASLEVKDRLKYAMMILFLGIVFYWMCDIRWP